MTRPRPRSRFALPGVIWAMAACALAVGSIQAQEPGLELQLRDSELEYNAAQSEWESALNAFVAAEARWQRALDQVREAERSGEEEALETALARFHTQALELETQESRQEETARALTEARNGLKNALALSREALYEDALSDETPPEQRRELAALIQDRSNRYRTLEEDGEEQPEFRLVATSEIAIDPRDGPDELNAKIRFMELRIRQMEDDIQNVTDRIDTLEREQRQERDLQNLMAGVERFDDTFVPVTTSGSAERGDDPPLEGLEINTLDDLSTEQQIEGLRLLQEQMFDWVRGMEIRVQSFQQRLIRLTTS